jgi:hypothetical protein
MRPELHWFCEFGDSGDETSSEKKFDCHRDRKWKNYKDTPFYSRDRAFVIKWWFNRVEEDTSGITFQE